MANRTVTVELVSKVAGYKSGLSSASASTKEFAGGLDGMRKSSKSNFDELSKGAAVAGTALLGLIGWATKVSMEFDKQMSEVGAITNATAGEMDKLRTAALDAGQATIYSATDAAKAEAELAKAGLTTSDILGGALKGALSLAAAGSLDLAEAAEIAAKTMGQFQLAGKDVGHVADLLAGAANASATDVHDLGEALKMGGGAAHAAGMSVEDTTTVLTAFAKQALVGSDAGTSLKTMLMMLEAPTAKSADKMKELGLDIYDANGNMIDAYAIAGQLQSSLKNLTQEERNKAIVTIFGADAQRAANALYALGSDGLRQLNKDMLAQSDAARVAQQKTNNLSGDIERLQGSLESLMISAQSGSTGPLRFIVQTLDHMVSAVSGLPPVVQQSIFILAGLTGAALLGAVAFMKVRTQLLGMLAALEATGPAGARAAAGLGSVASMAGKASLALAAVEVVSLALHAAFYQELNPDVKALSASLVTFGQTGESAGESARLFGGDMKQLDQALSNATSSGKGFAQLLEHWTFLDNEDNSWTKNVERINSMDKALADLAASGHADEAAAAFKRVWEEAQKQGISLEDLQKAFPQYISAAAEAAKAAATQTVSTKATTEANIKLAGAFGEAASAAKGLQAAYDTLNGAELTWRGAERDAEQAIDDLTDALKDSNGSLDVHTAKGRAAAAAVDKVAESAGAAAQAKFDESQSVEAASATYNVYIDQLRKTLSQAGYTKKEIDNLVSSIAAMPTTKTVDISVNETTYKRTVSDDKRAAAGKMANGGILAFAAGGTYERHVAQIAPAGAMRLWAEPETGGEAYIPLSQQKRARSVATLADVDRRFGYPLSGGGGGSVQVVVSAASGADTKLLSGVMQYLRFTVDTQYGGSAQAALTRRKR